MRAGMVLALAFSAAMASGAGALSAPVPAALALPPTVYPQRRRSRPLTNDDVQRLAAANAKRARKAARKGNSR